MHPCDLLQETSRNALWLVVHVGLRCHFVYAYTGIPLWFGLCSLDSGEKKQEQIFIHWMLKEAFRINPSFAPAAIMLDKASSEHKAVENVLMERAKAALEDLQQLISAERHTVSREEVTKARTVVKEREARSLHLQLVSTASARWVLFNMKFACVLCQH